MGAARSGHRVAWLIGVACALFLVGAAACGDDGRSAESEALVPEDPEDLDGSNWLLIATGDTDALPEGTTLTLRIEDGTASGNGPCNLFNVAFELDGDDLETGEVASTAIACPDPVTQQETELFEALATVDTALMEDDRLVLTGPDDVRLVFERADDAGNAVVGEWDVVNYATGDALKSVIEGTDPRLTFDEDGTLAIATGCNSGGADWTADGQELTIERARSTLMACEDPPGVMEQETEILGALTRVATVEAGAGTAQLLDADGNIVFVLARDG